MLFGMVSFFYLVIMGGICGLIVQIPFIKKKINTYLNSLEDFED